MRVAIARAMRKLADLIDPRVQPSQVMTVVLELDSSGFNAELSRIQRKVNRVAEALE